MAGWSCQSIFISWFWLGRAGWNLSQPRGKGAWHVCFHRQDLWGKNRDFPSSFPFEFYSKGDSLCSTLLSLSGKNIWRAWDFKEIFSAREVSNQIQNQSVYIPKRCSSLSVHLSVHSCPILFHLLHPNLPFPTGWFAANLRYIIAMVSVFVCISKRWELFLKT